MSDQSDQPQTTKPAMPPQSMIRLVLPFILVGVAMLIVTLAGGYEKDEADEGTPTVQPETQPQPESEASSAPQPLSPPDGTLFVDSAQTLTWEWSPGLAENQRFVVRVWYGIEPPREEWTDESSFDASKAIDSFEQAIGPFYWQVAAVTVNEDGGFASMASEWSPTQTLERVREIDVVPVSTEVKGD